MSYRLACELTDKIAAIAPVAASMSDFLYYNCAPSEPISVLFIMGTEDPLMPWEGGEIRFGRLRLGRVVSAFKTVQFWAEYNECISESRRRYLPDKAPSDGTRVWRKRYARCNGGTEVILLGIEGGGHTWPGGLQYLPERIIGKTCRDIDACEVIWSFFRRHSK